MTTHYQKIQALGNKMVSNLESMGVSANFNDGGMTLADKILEIQHFDNGLKLYADKNIGQIGDEINLYALVLKDNIAQSGKTILFKGLVNSTGTTKTFNANSTNIIGDKYEITSFPDLSNGSKVYLDKDHKIWLVHMGGDYGTVLQFLSQNEQGTNGTGTLSKIVVENNTLTYWVSGYSVTINFKNGGYDRDLSVITTENNTLTITDYSVYGVTGNNGIANVTYTCSGVGDKNIQAIYQSSNGTLLIQTFTLQDCEKYISNITHTVNNPSDSGVYYLEYTLQSLTDKQIIFDFKSTNNAFGIALSEASNNLVHGYGVAVNLNGGFNCWENTTNIMSTSKSMTINTKYNFRLEINGTALSYYLDDVLVASGTLSYNPLYLITRAWNSSKTITITDLKIKPL